MPEVRLVHFQFDPSLNRLWVLDDNGTLWYTLNHYDQSTWVRVKSPLDPQFKHAETESDSLDITRLEPPLAVSTVD